MTVPGPQPGGARLTARQVVGWGLTFLAILALIILFFVFGPKVRPILGAGPQGVWLTNSS